MLNNGSDDTPSDSLTLLIVARGLDKELLDPDLLDLTLLGEKFCLNGLWSGLYVSNVNTSDCISCSDPLLFTDPWLLRRGEPFPHAFGNNGAKGDPVLSFRDEDGGVTIS